MKEGTKRSGKRFLLMMTVFLICVIRISAYGDLQIEMEPDEWTWEAGETAFFHGSIVPDQNFPDAVLELTADTRLGDAGELQFLSVNGKNIKIRKRAPTVTTDLTAGEETTFTAGWILPSEADGTLKRADICLQISDAEGHIIGEGKLTAGSPEENTALLESSPVRSADRLILFLAILCAVVWISAVGRYEFLKRRA